MHFIRFIVVASVLFTGSIHPGWAGAPPNPTPSDGANNTAGGTEALFKNQGFDNSAFGAFTLNENTAGNYNTATGAQALYFNKTGSANTASGYATLWNNTTGWYNTASGLSALSANTTGNENTATGARALRFNSTGSYNTATGVNALLSNTSGGFNSASGYAALSSNTVGKFNTASGLSALSANTTGDGNTASGANALLANTTGAGNTAAGANALSATTTAGNNTAHGAYALYRNTTGSANTAAGVNALKAKTTGSGNTALGYGAGQLLTTGSNNIYLGHPGAASENSTLRLGQVQTRTFVAGVRNTNVGVGSLGVYINASGQLGTISSSARFKEDIRDMDAASRKLLELRPVTYHYKQPAPDGSKPLEYGLIAEEVAKVYPDLVTYGADGQVETVQYHKLTPMLLNEVQRLSKVNQIQAEQLRAEQTNNQAQAQAIAQLTQRTALMREEAGQMKSELSALREHTRRIEALEVRLMAVERPVITKASLISP